MKRFNNLYEKVYSIENLKLADSKARKGKKTQYGVIAHDKNQEANIISLHEMLKNKKYKTSEYKTFKIFEGKERIVYKLPYFPDRIAHHAIMNILVPIIFPTFTADTYSCIKGKGIHAASEAVKKALQNKEGTKFCLKIDIKKFYPNIDHAILKRLLRKKIKDQDLLWLLDGIIDSATGVPIGNFLSQMFANFYLTYFDHWIKEDKRVKYYFRYADDMVILSDSKEYLHDLLKEISVYLQDNLKLTVKDNHQVFPVEIRGIDFVGYVHREKYTRLRPRTKKRFARMMVKRRNPISLAAYLGLTKHCDSKHLVKKLTKEKIKVW